MAPLIAAVLTTLESSADDGAGSKVDGLETGPLGSVLTKAGYEEGPL